jgi:SSS family solute:Na+ symporter
VGLMLAAVLSAAMSTLSSSLNASASAVLNDFWIPLSRRPLSESRQVQLSRLLTLGFGVLQAIIAIQAARLSKSVVDNALTIAGFSAGILLGIFSLGILSRRAGQGAALIGAAVGLVVLLVVQFRPIEQLPVVAWPWLALIGASTTFAAGQLAAVLTEPSR